MQSHGDMNTITSIYAALTATALVVACASHESEPVVNTAADQPMVTSQNHADHAVVDRLAGARCDQEQRCNNIGDGQKFASREVCIEKMRGNIGNDLNAYNCPRGLDSEAIDRCNMAISSEECGHPFDTITRMDKCRTGAICLK
jgi:hypothetical protein